MANPRGSQNSLIVRGKQLGRLNEKGICTIDEAKKRRNEIINIVAITFTVGVIGYFVFLYVIVEYAGMWLGIWR